MKRLAVLSFLVLRVFFIHLTIKTVLSGEVYVFIESFLKLHQMEDN